MFSYLAATRPWREGTLSSPHRRRLMIVLVIDIFRIKRRPECQLVSCPLNLFPFRPFNHKRREKKSVLRVPPPWRLPQVEGMFVGSFSMIGTIPHLWPWQHSQPRHTRWILFEYPSRASDGLAPDGRYRRCVSSPIPSSPWVELLAGRERSPDPCRKRL